MIELLPCPFCGGKAELYGINNSNPFIVYCTNCGVEMGNEKDFLTYQAIEAWNTRIPNTSCNKNWDDVPKHLRDEILHSRTNPQ